MVWRGRASSLRRTSMRELRPFLIALRFLTLIPVRLVLAPTPEEDGRALVHYPTVGLVIGAVLAVLVSWLDGAPALLGGALVLVAWVVLSGALHLDGLADSADAWLGGIGDRERTLAIMQDPRCGPAAVVALVLLLLLKFAALAQLVPGGHWMVLVVVPLLGRVALVWLFMFTPYVRPQGISSTLVQHLPRRACLVSGAIGLAVVPLLLGLMGIWLLLAAVLTFWLARTLMLRRLTGTTGDTAGALVELVETAVLVTAALILAG